MKKITSKVNSAVKEVKRLRKREHRQKTGLVIVEGYTEVSRALQAKIAVEVLYICPEIFEDKKGEFTNCNTIEVTKDVFEQMAFGDRLKGILALCKPEQLELKKLKLGSSPLIVVLEAVEKPGNLGAVLRSCDGAGVDAVILCDGRTDVFNHNVVRSSLGTVFTVQTADASKEELFDYLKENKVRILSTTSKADLIYTQCDLRQSGAIIIGNEHEGLSQFWIDHADEKIKIPLKGIATCLNASASASIIIYEALRQRAG